MKLKEKSTQTYYTNKGEPYKVIFNTDSMFLIQFEDKHIQKYSINDSHGRFGSIANIMYPSSNKIGLIGIGGHSYKGEDEKTTKAYKIWYRMICNDKYEICDEWKNFQNFADWYERNYYELDSNSMALIVCTDKYDYYSPETSIFIPNKYRYLYQTIKKEKESDYPVGIYEQDGYFYFRVNRPDILVTKRNPKRINMGGYKTAEEAGLNQEKIRKELAVELMYYLRNDVPYKVFNKLKEIYT